MASWRRAVLGPILGRLGLTATALDERAWLVQRPSGRPLVARRVGPPAIRTHLVVDEPASRRRPSRFQISLGTHAGDMHLSWVLDALDVTCVLDVGANTGQFGRRLRAAGYPGRIVSFEPVAAIADQLRLATREDPDWWVRQVATGAEDASAEINVVPGTMSSLLPASAFGRKWSDRLGESHTETIAVHRLDGLLDEVTAGLDSPRLFLKMDTQGFDLPTLTGLGDRIDEVVGLQSELAAVPIYDGMTRYTEQLTAYEAHGFELSGLFPVTHDAPTLRIIEFDAVMVRPDAVVPR